MAAAVQSGDLFVRKEFQVAIRVLTDMAPSLRVRAFAQSAELRWPGEFLAAARFTAAEDQERHLRRLIFREDGEPRAINNGRKNDFTRSQLLFTRKT